MGSSWSILLGIPASPVIGVIAYDHLRNINPIVNNKYKIFLITFMVWFSIGFYEKEIEPVTGSQAIVITEIIFMIIMISMISLMLYVHR